MYKKDYLNKLSNKSTTPSQLNVNILNIVKPEDRRTSDKIGMFEYV